MPDQFGDMAVDDGDVAELAAEDMALGDGLVGDVDQPVDRLLEDELSRVGIGVDAHIASDEHGGGFGVDIADTDDIGLWNILECL